MRVLDKEALHPPAAELGHYDALIGYSKRVFAALSVCHLANTFILWLQALRFNRKRDFGLLLPVVQGSVDLVHFDGHLGDVPNPHSKADVLGKAKGNDTIVIAAVVVVIIIIIIKSDQLAQAKPKQAPR